MKKDGLMKKDTTFSISRIPIIEERLDRIEGRIDDLEHIDADNYPVKDESPYVHNNTDEVQAKFSKAFMKGILDQCDIDGCDGVEIVIYKHGKRVRSYEYDETI